MVNDVEMYSSRLVVTGESSNLALVSPEGIAVDLSGSKRTVAITPAANAFGEAVITITVSDGGKQATMAFTLTVNEVNEPPMLSIVRSGEGKLAVEWSGGGELQASDNMKKWQFVEDAGSPLAVNPAEARKYYRVILE